MGLPGKATAEAVGTFGLTFVGGSAMVLDAHDPSLGLGLMGVAAAHAIVLAVLVSATMNISGAHFNPAVSLSMFLTRKIDGRTLGVYVVTQLASAVLAAAAIIALLPAGGVESTAAGLPRVDGEVIGTLQAVGLEVLLTFLLVFVIWGTAVSRRAPPGIAGFGIGLVVFADILAGGPLTGASMNPARSFGPALLTGNLGGLHWVHWVGPLLGATLGAVVYEWMERA